MEKGIVINTQSEPFPIIQSFTKMFIFYPKKFLKAMTTFSRILKAKTTSQDDPE